MRPAVAWAAVNGGVLAVAFAVSALERATRALTHSQLVSTIITTAFQYLVVFCACSFNLRGRRRAKGCNKQMRPVALSSVWSHPVGSMCERYIHAHTYLSTKQSLGWLHTLPVMLGHSGLRSTWLGLALHCGSVFM
ncbi:MAG: hypothetical protein SGPRY_004110, partial [Prymnesium sp.]